MQKKELLLTIIVISFMLFFISMCSNELDKANGYIFTYELIFCDDRPVRIVRYKGCCEREIFTYKRAVPEFRANKIYYNVCEVKLISKVKL